LSPKSRFLKNLHVSSIQKTNNHQSSPPCLLSPTLFYSPSLTSLISPVSSSFFLAHSSFYSPSLSNSLPLSSTLPSLSNSLPLSSTLPLSPVSSLQLSPSLPNSPPFSISIPSIFYSPYLFCSSPLSCHLFLSDPFFPSSLFQSPLTPCLVASPLLPLSPLLSLSPHSQRTPTRFFLVSLNHFEPHTHSIFPPFVFQFRPLLHFIPFPPLSFALNYHAKFSKIVLR